MLNSIVKFGLGTLFLLTGAIIMGATIDQLKWYHCLGMAFLMAGAYVNSYSIIATQKKKIS